MNRIRANQGGSTTSFLLVGVAFIIMVAGGLYVLKNREGTNTTKPASRSVSPSPSSSAQKQQKNTAAPVPKSSQAPTKQPGVNHGLRSQNGSSAPLPKTGPSESVATIIVAALLTSATVAYLQSRKSYTELFRR